MLYEVITIGIGRLALAGISVTLPLFTFILATGLLIGVGSGALISLNLGAKKKLYAENILGNAVVLFFIVGGLYTVLGLIFIDDILNRITSYNVCYTKLLRIPVIISISPI